MKHSRQGNLNLIQLLKSQYESNANFASGVTPDISIGHEFRGSADVTQTEESVLSIQQPQIKIENFGEVENYAFKEEMLRNKIR
jgi:hypothetical protein